MSLILRISPQALPQPQKQGFNWGSWYEKNKKRLAEKKKKRYADDAEYRNAIKARSREQRKEKTPVDDNGFNVSFSMASELVGVGVWSLREWRRKNYFPEPVVRQSRYWFNSHQIDLLRKLADFFAVHGIRTKRNSADKLNDICQYVHNHWNTIDKTVH